MSFTPWATLLLSILIILSIFPIVSSNFNYLGCANYPAWEIDYNHSSQQTDSIMFQDWLFAWQHNPWRCKTYGVDTFLPNYGIGNTYLRSVIAFARSIEGGKILRPSDGYFWASNCENCTYNITSLDCYFQGLSSCSLDPIKSTATDLMNQDDRETKFGKRLAVANPDICTQAMAIKKPIAWVAGQYLSYIIRPRHDIQAEIYERIKGVLPNINRKHESFIAVHYRGGQPDFNRKVIPLDSYMKAVHQKAELLAMEGRPVSVVYLASQDNVHLFMNTSFLKENYGGNFTYKFLPPLTSNVDPSKEIELELRSHPDIPRKPYVVEFLADFQLMVKADVFIGSISTIYMIVMLLRYARHPGRRKDFTCLINTNSEIVCEDDPRKYDIYYNFNYLILGNGGGGEDRFGGLKGGTPF